MIDGTMAAATPSRIVESRSARDEAGKADAQPSASVFSRAFEEAKGSTVPAPDTASVPKQDAMQPPSRSEGKIAVPLSRRPADGGIASRSDRETAFGTPKAPGSSSKPDQRADPASHDPALETLETAKEDNANGETFEAEPTVAPHEFPVTTQTAGLAYGWTGLSQTALTKEDDGVADDVSPVGTPVESPSKAGRFGHVVADTVRSAGLPGRYPLTDRSDAPDAVSGRRSSASLAADTAHPANPTSSSSETALTATTSAEASTLKLTDAFPTWAMASTSPSKDALPVTPADRLAVAMHASPGAPEFADELGADIRLMLRDGFGKAELSLNPLDLGPIHIEIRVREQIADISFAVTSPVTREAIEHSLSQLNELLMHEGMALGNSSVSSELTDGRQSRDPHKAPPGYPHAGHPFTSKEPSSISDSGQRRLLIMAAAHARGGVDHYA